ncbi:GNAT family N-acetyltransferase [Modestobacter sp. I12A-02628]|uniref:GNAT family N-acetyltransferase n=1 Tax=Goekera deserti TaxID=2497753 RepID=A0A7K3WAN5_9ACTN|nr:GNAT family N-acetyltransferase [Goekera deserti]MPQ99240.1 GNAT family N-acetyltransferase [Goekera deserti]NDI47575.1 GNAT family N-acetyltransferase [Goekera deserti]NEL53386.1 GNAT family N-acetyltransferase [Goekera deserti]
MPSLVPPVVPPGSLSGRAQPVLTAGRLVLRPWAVTDAPAVTAAYADPAIQHWHARTMTPEEATAWVDAPAARWAAETGAGWAVTEHGTLVGRMDLRTLDLHEGLASVAYWVVPAARGRGVAARALDAMTRWALDELGLNRLELQHSAANPASCAVARACGYDLEGTKRREARHADGFHDMHLHARLRALA